MNAQFHTPSFGDEVFELDDVGATTSTPITSISNNNSYMYQQQASQTVNQTKRMVSLHNTSDEYHTANEESFTTNTSLMNTTNNGVQQQGEGSVTPTSTMTTPTTTMAARKQMLPLNENEPAKPLSAYALFFRDTVSVIKQQNPTCSFQELSKIVASMWDALNPVQKGVYNQKNELAKIEYLKQMKIYRQQLEQQQQQQQEQMQNSNIITANNDTTNTVNSISQHQQPQQNTPQVVTTTNNQQQNPQPVINNITNTATTTDEQIHLLTEAGSIPKCTREHCTKRAIINPDWEDEYCSNECVIIHCRNVFNAWVQSNLEAKQQSQQQQQSTTT